MTALFNSLQFALKKYLDDDKIRQITDAFKFASDAHSGQVRQSNEPYITHPVEVAKILANLEQDTFTIQAALLHDTIEDCSITEHDIESTFNTTVSQLVVGVTKLAKLSFNSRVEEQANNYRKMLIAMAKDMRVIIIKLADRLHNMRTLHFLSEAKQKKIAQETLDIYAPLAHRLGMASIKWELEDLAFYYLDYKQFQDIKKMVVSKRDEREHLIANFIRSIRSILSRSDIKANIQGRPKHFYSIHKKIIKHDITFDELYDHLAIRIIVDNVKQCYEILGLLHASYKPIPNRFKDYIAMPKTNQYQSLHTTVIGPKGNPYEIQIRTQQMHQLAEFGIAAHWHYKEGQKPKKFKSDLSWLRQVIELEKETDQPKEFLEDLKEDLFMDEVFAFTPQGDVKALSRGATALDFAYLVHTEVGHCCIGAKVDGHIVPLDHPLINGNRVEIMTSKTPNPKVDWLQFVQTRQARSKIKQWFKRQSHDDLIIQGEEKLKEYLKTEGLHLNSLIKQDVIDSIIDELKLSSINELYLAIGQGDVSSRRVLMMSLKRIKKEPKPMPSNETTQIRHRLRKRKGGMIRVLGESNILVNLAKCCSPLPGDDVIGFISKARGVMVHRTDCRSMLQLDDEAKKRLVDVEWNHDQDTDKFPATIQIEAFDRLGVLQDIMGVITEAQLNIREIKSKLLKDETRFRATIMLELTNTEEVSRLRRSLLQISDVVSVNRLIK